MSTQLTKQRKPWTDKQRKAQGKIMKDRWASPAFRRKYNKTVKERRNGVAANAVPSRLSRADAGKYNLIPLEAAFAKLPDDPDAPIQSRKRKEPKAALPQNMLQGNGNGQVIEGVAIEVNLTEQTIALDFGGAKIPLRFVK